MAAAALASKTTHPFQQYDLFIHTNVLYYYIWSRKEFKWKHVIPEYFDCFILQVPGVLVFMGAWTRPALIGCSALCFVNVLRWLKDLCYVSGTFVFIVVNLNGDSGDVISTIWGSARRPLLDLWNLSCPPRGAFLYRGQRGQKDVVVMTVRLEQQRHQMASGK